MPAPKPFRRLRRRERQAYLNEQIATLTALYRNSANKLQTQLLAGRMTSAQRQRTVMLLRQIRMEIAWLDKQAREWAENAASASYQRGQAMSAKALWPHGIRPDTFALIHTTAVNIIADEITRDLLSANASIKRNLERFVRQAKVTQLQDQMMSRAVAQGLIEGQTGRSVAANISQQLIRDLGEGKLVQAGARKFTPEYYAELVARTRTREAASLGTLQSGVSAGIDLFRVSLHPHEDRSGDRCPEFAGKIFAASGGHKDFPPLEMLPPFHPNCTHTITPVVEFILHRRNEYEQMVKLSKPGVDVLGALAA